MSTNTGGPKTAKGKAVSRMNAARFGVYSVTPVIPHFERERDWQAHRTGVFNDLPPEGYMQEIIAERIAVKTWRLRRLVRYEREQVRNRQRNIPEHLALVSRLEGRRPRDDEEASLKLIDRWAMDALVPREKELAILMRWEGRLTRELRLDMLQIEHMQRQRRNDRQPALSGRWGSAEDTKGQPLLSLAEPEPVTQPVLGGMRGLREGHEGAYRPQEPESFGDPSTLSPLPRSGDAGPPREERLGVRDPQSHPFGGLEPLPEPQSTGEWQSQRPATEPESLGAPGALRQPN